MLRVYAFCFGSMLLQTQAIYVPNNFFDAQQRIKNGSREPLADEFKELAETVKALPQAVWQKTCRLVEKSQKGAKSDTRAWYQKKRYWALISTVTLVSGGAGGIAAAKIAALAHASQTTVVITTAAAGLGSGAAGAALTIYVIKEYHGHEIKVTSNGVYISNKKECNQ